MEFTLQPLLYPALREALACLYNLKGPSHPEASFQANAYLTNFQSRNIARRIESIRRSQKAALEAKQEPPSATQTSQPAQRLDNSAGSKDDLEGSSWLACLALLITPDAHDAERIFCAQTMHHRVRRMSLQDAVDVEFEPWMMQSLNWNVLQAWLHHQLPSMNNINISQAEDENSQKGQLSITALASTLMLLTVQIHNPSHPMHHPVLHPLLTNLGAALALTAVRLRNTPNSEGPLQSSPTLVTLIQSSLQAAAHVLLQSHEESRIHTCLAQCLCSALGELPDSLLGTTGGAREKLSLDPRCIYAASAELRQESTGTHLLLSCLHQIMARPDQLEIKHTMVLSTVYRWACFIPLCLPLLEAILPIVVTYLPYNQHICHKSSQKLLLVIFEGASLTQEQVIALSMGLSTSTGPSSSSTNKKSPKGRAKKRRDQKLNALSTDEVVNHAANEAFQRRAIAVWTAYQTISPLQQSLHQTLATLQDDPDGPVDGEGSIGVTCACAATCLSSLLNSQNSQIPHEHVAELVSAILSCLVEMASSPNRNARRLTHDAIVSLHATLLHLEENNIVDIDSSTLAICIKGVFEVSLLQSSSTFYCIF